MRVRIIEDGRIVYDPKCYRLVQLGLAVADDDECRAKIAEWEAEQARVAKIEEEKAEMEEARRLRRERRTEERKRQQEEEARLQRLADFEAQLMQPE